MGLPTFPPVCALVRNDMQKEGRVRGCKGVLLGECTGGVVRPCNAYAQQISACHCEERSDVAIRIPAEVHNK